MRIVESFDGTLQEGNRSEPLEYLQSSRIENTKRLLATTQLGLDEIAHRVGYEDPGSLRRIFVREAGISPGAYRRSFALGQRP